MAGETRTINGVTAQWDGQGWKPVNQPEMYHPTQADTPFTAGAQELGRTAKEAAVGMARSPVDLVKNLFNTVAHPVDTVTNAAHAVAHPLETAEALGDNPREAGSQLGQLLLGKFAGPKVPGVVGKIPEGISAAGRGMETAGTALADSKIGGFGIPGLGVAEAVMRHDPAGIAVAATPYALKYGGKGVQKIGAGLQALKGEAAAPAVERFAPNVSSASPAQAAVETPPLVEPPTGVDRYAPNVGGLHEAASVPSPELVDEPSVIDRYMPNASARTAAGRVPSPETASDLTDALMSKFPSELRATTQDMAPAEFGATLDNPDWFSTPTSTPEPLSRLDMLRARQAEKYGRAFRPEF